MQKFLNSFFFHAPTKVHFGEGMFSSLGRIVSSCGFQKIFLISGQKHSKENGLNGALISNIDSHGGQVWEFCGITPNPDSGIIDHAAALCLNSECDSIVALGGGSVIDAAKAVAILASPDSQCKNIWPYVEKKVKVKSALPVIAIPTIAGSGSEVDGISVISNRDCSDKRDLFSREIYPYVAIVDPLLTETVPKKVWLSQIVDIFSHVAEPYLTSKHDYFPLDDGFSEVLMKNLISESYNILHANSVGLNIRSNVHWASIIAMNGVTKAMRNGPHPIHQIEHFLSGVFDMKHSDGVAILFPEILKIVEKDNPSRYRFFTERTLSSSDFKTWFNAIGVPLKMSDIGIEYSDDYVEEMAKRIVLLYGNRKGNLGLPSLNYEGVVDLLIKIR